RRRAAGRGAATEYVVVQTDVEVVVLRDAHRSLRKWLVAVAALLVEVRIDADSRREPPGSRKHSVKPDAILRDRAAELERALLVVVNLVRKLLVRRVVADEARRNDVEAAETAEGIAARLGHDVDDAALEVVVLGLGPDGVQLHF